MTSSAQQEKTVRLTPTEKQKILDVIASLSKELGFAREEISLFGSRINSQAKGGDMDLYLKIKSKAGLDTLLIKRKIRIALKDELGDQKIDLIIDDSQTDLGAFGKIILKNKINLWTRK